jgi:hypothetical protein
VIFKGKVMLEESPLGLVTKEGDFSANMELVQSAIGKIEKAGSTTGFDMFNHRKAATVPEPVEGT